MIVGIEYACIEDGVKDTGSVISRGEVSASCGQAYQISTLVILYIDLKGS